MISNDQDEIHLFNLNQLEKEYNSVRHDLFINVRRYYNQSIASKMVTETELREMVDKCEEIKKEYFKIQSQLLARRPDIKTWSFRTDFTFGNRDFVKEIENDSD